MIEFKINLIENEKLLSEFFTESRKYSIINAKSMKQRSGLGISS